MTETKTEQGGRIVVGVDGSDGSLAALRWALREARIRGAEVHAVIAWTYHPSWGYSGLGSMFPPAYNPGIGLMPGLEPGVPASVEEAAETEPGAEVRGVLDEAISKVSRETTGHEPDVTVTADAVPGHAAQVLLDAASASDLLVVGSRGHGGFVGALLGSVSHHVVSNARCPVVVVPEPARGSDE